MRPYGICALFVLAGCTALPSASKEEVGRAASPIINGRPSGDDENASVYIVTQGEVSPLHCSGRIIAPGLVLTARHCLIKRKTVDVRCTADGSPVDISDTVDTRLEPVEQMTVYVGSNRSSARAVAVKRALATFDVTVCRADLAYLVLSEPGVDTRTPIRRALPAIGETVSVTGWGYVDDVQREKLPDVRSTVETTINAVGPGLVPPGAFAVPGGTMCLGDSGANALIDGAAVGVYTRLLGDASSCVPELGRNVLVSVMAEPELLTEAFAAIGEEPWFVGEERPWLAAAGAACQKDDDCRSGVCGAGTCRAGCGPTKLACKVGQECAADGQCVNAPAAPPPVNAESCSATFGATNDGISAVLLVLVTVAIRRGKRRVTRV